MHDCQLDGRNRVSETNLNVVCFPHDLADAGFSLRRALSMGYANGDRAGAGACHGQCSLFGAMSFDAAFCIIAWTLGGGACAPCAPVTTSMPIGSFVIRLCILDR